MGCFAGRSAARVDWIDAIADSEGDPPHRSAARDFHSRYALEERLGEGHFARVYACRKLGGPGERLAVKVTDLRGRKDVEARERFARQEARILRRVGDREHCCRLVDSMSCRRFHYIVLEMCSRPLAAVLGGVPELTELSLAGFVRQMFAAVACVHALDVVHRDVKPDNFLCAGPERTVKLCDFGLAELVPAGGGVVTGSFGTAPFMSPEAFVGSAHGTPTDVWSLGVVVYALVIGQFPYVPEKPQPKFMKAAVVSGVPEPSFSCVAKDVELSQQVLDLLEGLLRRDPAERPRAAEALGHCWFGLESKGEQRAWHSLKEVLSAAIRVGAFTVQDGASEAGGQTPDSMDRALQKRQRRCRPQDGPDLAGEGGALSPSAAASREALSPSSASSREALSPSSAASREALSPCSSTASSLTRSHRVRAVVIA